MFLIEIFKYGKIYHSIMVINNDLSLKEKILKYLIENKEKPKTIRQISKDLGVDYKNTFQAISSLSELILKEKFGNTNMVKIKLMPSNEIFSIEGKRTKQFLRDNKKLELVKKDAESINYPFLIVLVFGSYVKRTNAKSSDIDACIICDNKEKIKEFISKLELLPFNLEIHTFSAKEFESMLQTKNENIGKEIVKNNILLYGIEAYYNLISKWMKKE